MHQGDGEMEYRKLISFGKSSYVISLPKNWIRQNKLKKGDLIYLDEKENNIFLTHESKSPVEEKSRTINVDGKEIPRLRRELNAAYVENFREIIFQGKELKAKSKELLEIIRGLIALEVLELDSSKIVTKDFLDLDKVSIIELVKKMDMIVRSMLKDCSLTFIDKSAENIALRDKDVNRLSFLIYRMIRYGMRNQSQMLKNFNLRPIDLLGYYWATFHLESIGDEAKRIARGMQDVKLSKTKQNQFVKLLKEAGEYYVHVLNAFYQTNIEKALTLSNRKDELVAAINQFYEENSNAKEIPYMVDRFRRLIAAIHELNVITYQR